MTALTWCVRVGAALWVLAMLAGASLLSPPHLAGAALVGLGLAALAWRGRLADGLAVPGPRTFAALFALAAAGHLAVVRASHESLAFMQYDTGIFAGRVHTLAVTGAFWCPEHRIHALADHFSPVLAAFVPLYRLWPTYLWLPLAKVAAFLAAALILVRLARSVLGPDSRLVWVLPALWLVHGPLTLSALFEFQPNQLAPPFVMLAFLYAHERRPVALALALAATATLREDLPLVWVCLGGWLWLERGERLRGLALAAFATAWGLAVFAVVMPALHGGLEFHGDRLGPTAHLPRKLGALALALAAAGGLPLARPRTLLWALPAFAVNLLSATENMLSFRYHYYAVPHTVTLIAALYALADLESGASWLDRRSPRVRGLALAAGIAAAAAVDGMLPHRVLGARLPTPALSETRRDVVALGAQVPAGETVFACEAVAAALYDRGARGIGWTRLGEAPRPHAVLLTTAPAPAEPPRVHRAFTKRLRQEVAAGRAVVLAETPRAVLFRRLP